MSKILPHSLFVIFGATGDLAKRKLIPALFSLYNKEALENVSILAIGRKSLSSTEFRTYLQQEAIIKTESLGKRDDFFQKIDYLDLDINDPNRYDPLLQFTRMYPDKNIVFYLSTPPELFEPIVAGIANA